MDLKADFVVKKGRTRSIALARSITCTLAADRLIFSGADTSCKLGITPSAVCMLVARGRSSPLLSEIEAEILQLFHLFNFSPPRRMQKKVTHETEVQDPALSNVRAIIKLQ